MASKIAIGLTLDEIRNSVTGKTYACFEPTLDYCVIKFPRWPFDKFISADRTLGTQMKATGEVMSIDRTFESALMKAIRSLEIGLFGLQIPEFQALSQEELEQKLVKAEDQRLFAVAEFFRRGGTVNQAASLSAIDVFFLEKIYQVVAFEETLRRDVPLTGLTRERLLQAKAYGLADRYIGQLTGLSEGEVREARQVQGINAVYKMVDTCAAEFEAITPYYYSSYEFEDEATPTDRPKVVVLGSGPFALGRV
ncbi:hypothetical protein N752_14845 [Desulforamulus aquiferis]|nr:hypothetical protein N752_14845 [Desulforamulus aquiferis]